MLVESAVQTEVLRVKDPLQPAARKRVHESLAGIQGVEDSTVETDRITVSYYPHVISSGLIQREIEELGCVIDESAQRRGPIRRFIDKLAEHNAKTFGSSPPDCCSLNRKTRP